MTILIRRNSKKLLSWFLFVVFFVVLFGLLRSYRRVSVQELPLYVHVDTVASAEDYAPTCEVESWNQLTMDGVPNEALRKSWIAIEAGSWGNIYWSDLRVVSAFVYKEEIVVTTTTQNRYGKPIYCRYFDCNRVEIPNSTFESVVFPMSSAYCARRAGAKFMGLTDTEEGEALDPVPITFRAYDKPVHDVSVCVGPIYGDESRWLEIVETTEHHMLMGIRFFYFTILNEMDSYTRRLLDEYQRLGRAEVTVIQSEYKTMDWMFHMMQVTDCFFRSRHHSKWILNVDIDERIVMTKMPLPIFLQTIPDDVGEISFSTHKIQRNDALPTQYVDRTTLEKELLFLNYHTTSEIMYIGMKGLVRPDKTEAMFYHWTWAQYPGVRVMSASRKIGYVKHYRTTLPGLVQNWIHHGLKFRTTKLDMKFEEKLLKAIVRRVKRVYDQRPTWCEEVTPHLLTIFSNDNYHCLWQQNGTRYTGGRKD